MVEVEWSSQASQDLESIGGFIAKDSPQYARLFVADIFRALDRIATFPMNLAILLLTCGSALADPPSVWLVSVKITSGGETISGYSEYWEAEHYGPADAATVEELLRKRTIPIWPSDLDRVEHPIRFSYIFYGPRRVLDPAKVEKIEVEKGPSDGHAPFEYPFYQVSKRTAVLLRQKPLYQCAQAGASTSVIWLSYNPEVGAEQLQGRCSRKASKGLKANRFGKHPKFKDVFWFSYAEPNDND